MVVVMVCDRVVIWWELWCGCCDDAVRMVCGVGMEVNSVVIC